MADEAVHSGEDVAPDVDCYTLPNGECVATPCRLHDPSPSGELGTPEQRVAWLLWQVNEGYIKAEDRAIGTNWFLSPVGTEHPDDEAERPYWLTLAREVIAIVRSDVIGSIVPAT